MVPTKKGDGIIKFLLRKVLISFCMVCLFRWSTESFASTNSHDDIETLITKVKTDKKVVALTFDDGPYPKYTPQILDLLSQYQAKATFFVIGWRVKTYPDLIQREASEGHELGNHTFTHENFERMSTEQLRMEIKKSQEAIFHVTGKRPRLFRPPGGYLSANVKIAAKKENLRIANWSWDEDTRDWSRPGVQKIVNKVMTNLHPGDIILFHDRTSQTVQALKGILPELAKRGYRSVTISELITYDRRDGP